MKSSPYNNKKSAIKLDKINAIHEAGHRILQWYYGAVLADVQIINCKNENTEMDLQGQSCASICNNSAFTADRALMLLAGRAAVEAYFPEIDQGQSFNYDFQLLSSLVSLDDETISMHTWRKNQPEFKGECFYQSFKKTPIKILKSKQGRRAVKALTKALLKHKRLSGRESARILEKNWGTPLPPLALPMKIHYQTTIATPQYYNDVISEINWRAQSMIKILRPMLDQDQNSAAENARLSKINSFVHLLRVLSSESEEMKKI